MKGNEPLNTKNIISMLAAMVVFIINEVKGHNNVLARVIVNRFVDAISLIMNIF